MLVLCTDEYRPNSSPVGPFRKQVLLLKRIYFDFKNRLKEKKKDLSWILVFKFTKKIPQKEASLHADCKWWFHVWWMLLSKVFPIHKHHDTIHQFGVECAAQGHFDMCTQRTFLTFYLFTYYRHNVIKSMTKYRFVFPPSQGFCRIYSLSRFYSVPSFSLWSDDLQPVLPVDHFMCGSNNARKKSKVFVNPDLSQGTLSLTEATTRVTEALGSNPSSNGDWSWSVYHCSEMPQLVLLQSLAFSKNMASDFKLLKWNTSECTNGYHVICVDWYLRRWTETRHQTLIKLWNLLFRVFCYDAESYLMLDATTMVP